LAQPADTAQTLAARTEIEPGVMIAAMKYVDEASRFGCKMSKAGRFALRRTTSSALRATARPQAGKRRTIAEATADPVAFLKRRI